jgi:sulfate adenylyltransferase subunit 2
VWYIVFAVNSELKEKEHKSIHIIREANEKFEKLAILWSVGKDSTAILWLVRKAFFGQIPFPVIHVDTSFKFPEMIKFRDEIAKEWGLNLMIAQNQEALKKGMNKSAGRIKCCNALKTEALKQFIKRQQFDALLVGIRRDEHGIRAKERYFSPRDKEFKWDPKNQPPELWDFYGSVSSPQGASLAQDQDHIRVHPILHWTEQDVWEYMREENIPVNPLYFAKDGKRYRSLGCAPCTTPMDSKADTIDKIIKELGTTKVSERSGRDQDKEYMMEKLRALGYM